MDELSRLRMAELQEEEEEDTGSMLERAVEQAELTAKAEVIAPSTSPSPSRVRSGSSLNLALACRENAWARRWSGSPTL